MKMKAQNPSSRTKQQTDPDMEQAGAASTSSSQTPPRRTTTAPPDEVSPAETFDTALTSPTRTFDDSVISPTPTKITFEHNVKTQSRGGAGLILGMSKPALAIASLLLLGSGAAAALGWFKIPGLNNQIEELQAQVNRLNSEIDRLSSEVDRLQDENDRYESLNDRLNMTVAEFEVLTDDLNSTVQHLENVTGSLNRTNLELKDRVKELANENENYANLNQELNSTTNRLAGEVVTLRMSLDKMVLENSFLSNLTASLERMTARLGNLTAEQNETLAELRSTLEEFVQENDRLQELNGNLVSVVSFLNDTSLGLDDSLQQITGFLADQIAANKALVLDSLENTYRQRVSNWDCDYRDVFREEPFGANFSVPITDMTAVVGYVNQRVLSELCLDVSDFRDYLIQTNPSGITSYRLVRSVVQYTEAALDFYFPEDGETGLSPQDWGDASYSCEKLPAVYSWKPVAN